MGSGVIVGSGVGEGVGVGVGVGEGVGVGLGEGVALASLCSIEQTDGIRLLWYQPKAVSLQSFPANKPDSVQYLADTTLES